MTQEVKTSTLTMRQRAKPVALVAIAVFVLDQLSKYLLIDYLEHGARAPMYVNEYFSLVMAWNRGVSFSMFAHSAEWMPYVLTAGAVLISGVLVRLALHTPKCWEQAAYAAIIGGALGNAFDRVRFGAVADFFYAHIGDLGWPAFNVADMAICAGVGILLVFMVRNRA